jgi:uncharacterized protein (DUF58 family)
VPTPRLLLLLLVAAPLAALGGVWVLAAAALVAVVALAAALDWRLAAGGARLGTGRVVADKLSLGAWNPVRLEVTNPLPRRLRLELRDVVPTDFGRSPTRVTLSVSVGPRGSATTEYRVLPRLRGDYTFGELWVRWDGPLGLVRRSRRVAGSARPVRVYPNLRELKKYDLLVRRGLRLEAGGRPVRVAGASTEFERLREYLPDDDYRRINWKATARRGEPMVNQFEAERSQNLVLMLDAGRLMSARVELPPVDAAAAVAAGEQDTGLTKLDHALNAALLLAYVAGSRGDRVALLAYTDEVRAFVPPVRGRRGFLEMVRAGYNLRPEPIEPDHGRAFDFLAGRNLRRSLVVLFTDLVDRESSTRLVSHLVRAARHHLVVCVTLSDPTVVGPALARPTDTQALYETMVAQRLLDERASVLGTLTRAGVLSLDTTAPRLNPRLIDTYLKLKLRGRI